MKKPTLTEIYEKHLYQHLSYLFTSNNLPYYMSSMESVLNRLSRESDFRQCYLEICLAYWVRYVGIEEKSFWWYFEDIFEGRSFVNPDPGIEIREIFVDWFIERRKEVHRENMECTKTLYLVWKKIGVQRGFDVSFYPDDLDEIFE
ncbi:MAG: hypothetical protein WCJ51_03595 [Candidatus Moraniibacteriota bacterium]